jgi:hypothetical protein
MGSNLTRIRVAPLHPATPPLAHARLAKRATDLEHRTCPVVTGTDGASPAGRGQSEIDVSADTAWVPLEGRGGMKKCLFGDGF